MCVCVCICNRFSQASANWIQIKYIVAHNCLERLNNPNREVASQPTTHIFNCTWIKINSTIRHVKLSFGETTPNLVRVFVFNFMLLKVFSKRICCKLNSELNELIDIQTFHHVTQTNFNFQIIKYFNHIAQRTICIYSVLNFKNFIIIVVRKVSWVLCCCFLACVFLFYIYSLYRCRCHTVVCYWLVDRLVAVDYVKIVVKILLGGSCHAFMRKKKKVVPSLKSSSRYAFEISTILYDVDSNYVG